MTYTDQSRTIQSHLLNKKCKNWMIISSLFVLLRDLLWILTSFFKVLRGSQFATCPALHPQIRPFSMYFVLSFKTQVLVSCNHSSLKPWVSCRYINLVVILFILYRKRLLSFESIIMNSIMQQVDIWLTIAHNLSSYLVKICKFFLV